jgi:hypothetical protein
MDNDRATRPLPRMTRPQFENEVLQHTIRQLQEERVTLEDILAKHKRAPTCVQNKGSQEQSSPGR